MATNTTYTASNTDKGNGVLFRASAKVVFPADAITATDSVEFTVGFTPKHVKWVNLTDRIVIEWFQGMADNTCLKIAANGTQTLETTNGGITVSGTSFSVLQNATLAAIAASKTCYWIAEG